MTVNSPSTVSVVLDGAAPDPAGQETRSPLPVSEVHQWLSAILRDLPKPVEYQSTAGYSRAVVDYCVERWTAASGAEPPSVERAIAEFRETLLAAGDLSERQVDHVCQRTFGTQTELADWLYDTTERFLNVIKPWTPVWLGFTNWTMRWCRQNSIDTLLFLARDALPFFVAASALEQGLDLHLAHVSRATRPDGPALNAILAQPSVALIDSGCYGTCIDELKQRRDGLLDGAQAADEMATLLYYSRNPQLFGYVNYLMGEEMLASPETMDRATEFIIYAGDLLEALPKPYGYYAPDPTLVRLSDLVSFTVSIAALGDMRTMAKASTFLDEAGMNGIHGHVRLLYWNYQLSRHRSELRGDFLFDDPTPKSVPAPGALSDLAFLEIPPQSHIFGTVSG